MKKVVLFIVLIAFSSAYAKDYKYTEAKADFSNDIERTLKIDSFNRAMHNSSLFISCNSGKKLGIQLASGVVIFPDTDIKDRNMTVKITYKFTEAEKAVTSKWSMNFMKYKNAWYDGNKKKFLSNALTSKQLNLKLDFNGDVFKFKLSEELKNHIKEIQNACYPKK